MATVHKIQRNYQVTIPVDIRKKARLKVGDLVDFEVTENGILIKPQETIDRNQSWFWSKTWQDEEHKVQKDIQSKKMKRAGGLDDFFEELDKQ